MIFLKTKKVGGTSFEVALSKFCSDDCIITPISAVDEQFRRAHMERGAQNFRASQRRGVDKPDHVNFGVSGDFANHSPASVVNAALTAPRFENYCRVTIHRDPADFLVSQYFFRMSASANRALGTFSEWYAKNKTNVLENYAIAPVKGKYACDIVFDYSELKQQIINCDALPNDFWATFEPLSLKGQFRPKQSRNLTAFYESHGLDVTEPSRLLYGVIDPASLCFHE